MKRKLWILLALIMVLLLSACNNQNVSQDSSDSHTTQDTTTSDMTPDNQPPDSEQHTHTYKKEIITPTCENEGVTIYSCECGDKYIEDVVLAQGHIFGNWVEVTPATETANGKEERNRYKKLKNSF